MRDFLDEAVWGPVASNLDRATRLWLNNHQAAWPFLTDVVTQLLRDEIPISMKLIIEMARHNARKLGVGVRISNSYTTYIRDLICAEVAGAEKYLTGGRRKVTIEDRLEL